MVWCIYSYLVHGVYLGERETTTFKSICSPWEEKRRLATLHYNQRGLKDTERKHLGRLYLGVTHSTMSSAVQNFTQVKAWTGIMAVVVSSVS